MKTNTLIMPCPFCGGVPRSIGRQKTNGEKNGKDDQFVHFIACYCGGYMATAHKTGNGSSALFAERDAITRWNKRQAHKESCAQKTYSGTVEKDGNRYAITYLLTDTEYASFKSLGLIPVNTSEVNGHVAATDSEVAAIANQGQAEREAIESAGGATQ